jgi:Ca-activated chloride channel homolog
MNVIARPAPQTAGLFVEGTSKPVPLPLEGVRVDARIAGHASRVTMSQRFRNAEAVPIEAVYVFPLPESAAVCGLVMRVGDRRIEAEVEERDRAFERYDDAMAAGHGAVLLDAERPNVFTISVGNILPGQEVLVEITWVAELTMEGPAIRFALPTTVAPRYAPSEDLKGVSPTPAERVSPPVQLDVPYGFALDIDVVLACPVRAIDSPSHPVRFELDGPRAHVTLSHDVAAMDRDFVLLVTPLEAGQPQVLVERNADGLATAAVSLAPQLPSSTAPREVIFVVDRSGSMEGSSIEQVRAALHLCLRSLREGDLFNIVGFGSTFGSLFRKSASYGQGTLEKATAHVDTLRADLGGTEILPALQFVLEQQVPAGAYRQVVVLTDGEVTNEAAVIELAEAHAADARIFTFGIGFGPSDHLVRSLARATMGEAEFIHPGERIEPKVLRQFARLGTAALRNVEVEWQGADTTLQAPHRPAAIFNGEARVVYARFDPHRRVTVALSADAEGTPVSWSVAVDARDAEAGETLATLAARAAIRDLEEGTSALHDQLRGSAQLGRRDERIAKEVVALAKAHRLASSRTSFVAVERREAAGDQPAAELRRVPVALTHGWGGIERAAGGPMAVAAPRRAEADRLSAVTAPGSRAYSVRARLAAFIGRHEPDEGSSACLAPEPDIDSSALYDTSTVPIGARPAPAREHVELARLQHADGSWHLDAALSTVLGVGPDILLDLAKTLGGRDAAAIVATLAALRFLAARAADARDEWRLLAEKAGRWLDAALADRPAGARAELEQRLACFGL